MSDTFIRDHLKEEGAQVLSGIHAILAGEVLAALDRLGRFALFDPAAGARLVVRMGELRVLGNALPGEGVVNEYVVPAGATR